MQDVLYKAALDDSTPAKDKAGCARAWKDLEEQKRILRGQGAPKAVPARNEPTTRAARRKATIGLPDPE